jgi:hypothetical protein
MTCGESEILPHACDEATLAEVLSDPVTLAVMAADHVDRGDLTATLTRIAGEITAWRGRQ